MSTVLISPAGAKEINLRYSFILSLIFGPFYFGYLGVWDTAIISFILALISGGLSALIYPFFAEKIIILYYKNRGWKVKEGIGNNLREQAFGNCESCGAPMDIHTCSKMDIRYCIHCQHKLIKQYK
jgi:hypothetical protein